MRFLRFLPLSVGIALFTSCTPLVLDPDGGPTKPLDTVATTATLTVSNAFTHYPGTYTILVFAATAMTVQDPYAVRLGNVAENDSVVFTLSAGRWHIGVALPDGTTFPLERTPGSTEWLMVNPVAGKNYYLDLFTDGGGNNVWATNMPRE